MGKLTSSLFLAGVLSMTGGTIYEIVRHKEPVPIPNSIQRVSDLGELTGLMAKEVIRIQNSERNGGSVSDLPLYQEYKRLLVEAEEIYKSQEYAQDNKEYWKKVVENVNREGIRPFAWILLGVILAGLGAVSNYFDYRKKS